MSHAEGKTYHHSVFGLTLRANRRVPGLEPLKEARVADVSVHFAEDVQEPPGQRTAQTLYASRIKGEEGQPNLTVLGDGQSFQFSYRDGIEFVIDVTGANVSVSWLHPMTLEDAVVYLLGPVLGFILRLRGVISLHASSINIEGRAVAFLGGTGAGKSTIAAHFAKQGFPILSDDLSALWERGDEFWVQPGYPRVKLWPPSVQALYGESDTLALLTPNWDKQYLDLSSNGFHFQKDALPLAGIYHLGERTDEQDATRIETISPSSGMIHLITNTYGNYLLDKTMHVRMFDLLGRLARRIPIRSIKPYKNFERLPELCSAVIEDVINESTPARASISQPHRYAAPHLRALTEY